MQRTNQKFDARQICEGRVYSYFLPTTIVGLQLDGALACAAPLALMPSVKFGKPLKYSFFSLH